MLGLRKNPLGRRSRNSPSPSPGPGVERTSSEISSTTPSMESVRQKDTNVAKVNKPDVSVAVNEVNLSDSDESSVRQTDALSIIGQQQQESFGRTSGSIQITRVVQSTRTLTNRIVCGLNDVDDDYFEKITFQSYVEFIAEERLIHMPRKSSQWDRVLKAAEFFGYQIFSFSEIVADFVPESHYVGLSALAYCRLLLEVGHNQAQALEPTFDALYELGLLVARTVQKREFFSADDEVKSDIANIYNDLVQLVGEIALHYRLRINSMTTGSVTVDFDVAFGKTINRIWAQKEHLSNHMWNYTLRHKSYSIDIKSLRHKLSPVDQSLKMLLYGRLADKADCVEGSCEWIQPHLLEFLRGSEKVFTITGAAGIGKSMLAGRMTERLQRQLGRKSYETVTYSFSSDAPAEATTLAFLKNILFQLLERNVGDARLYEVLVKAFDGYSKQADNKKLEDSLWVALEAGLKTVEDQRVNLIIIADGLDEVQGTNAASHLHKHLRDCIEQFPRVRAITLSRPISHLGGSGCKHLVITPDHVHSGVVAYFRQCLGQYQHFKSQGQAGGEKFIADLMLKAKGSYLEAYLASKSLANEHSNDGFLKAGHAMPEDVPGLIHKIVNKMDLKKDTTTRTMLSLMLTAERPFTVREMEDLLNVNLEKRTIASTCDLRKHVAAHCSILIVERKGLLRFKHSEVRNFFLKELCGKVLMSMKEAHAELTKRMLFYAKYTLVVTYEPSFEILEESAISETFHSYGLIEYVIRNWTSHFRSSSFCGAEGELILSSEFKEIFPDSTHLAMLEWTCWKRQYSVSEAVHLHDLTLRIRTACFGEKHRTIMQNLIILGSCHRSSSSSTKAAEFFYRASCVGQIVLYKYSPIVVTCTDYFLVCTEKIVITERTQIVTYREEMIRFMIEICKTKHGGSSDQVIKWYEILAKLYISIKEEHCATVIYKELYEIIVVRFGKGHARARHICETLGGLTVVLKGEKENGGGIIEYGEFIFETSEEMEESDELRISIILHLCRTYEAHGKWVLAEKLYISFWRRISELCRIKATLELHVLKISIALEYIRFLQRTKRVEEATSILICLWAEYEHHHCESETIVIRIREIGAMFKAFGLLTIAITVLKKVWGWFKEKGKTEHEEAGSTIILISEVVEEITETTTNTKTTTTTTTTETETVIKEIFETTYTRCKHSTVDQSFFKSCMAIICLYIKQGKWSECEVVIKRSLELTWKAILTVDAKITISGSFVKECILVAIQLAVCYHRQMHFEKAEEIYLRIYRACVHSFKIDHECVTEASLVLIRFYEEYHRHDKVIEIYLELLKGYKSHCGATHVLTIKTLYALGSICLMIGHKDAYKYYIEIVTVLNRDGHCHHDAFEAAIIICKHYHETHQWVELRKICVVLWESFVHHHDKFTYTEEMIISLYERYIYVLEFQAKVEFSVLYKLSVEYRETVTKCFGPSASIVIIAMIALAKICEKHEEHWHESVTVYEEVIRKEKTVTTTTTTTTETTVTTVKKRLSKMYITIITKGKSSTTTTCERGLVICLEIYEQLKVELGCWHETTLTQLKEIILIYRKIGAKDCNSTIIRMLQVSVIEIITKTTTSMALYQAALTIASIYVSCGMIQTGQSLLHQLRHLIVLHDLDASLEITISLGGCKVSKIAFVFLMAFEQVLTEKIICSYSEVMADILLETQLYEHYTEVIKVETKMEIVFEVSAKLRSFWIARGRKSHCDVLDKKLFALFKSKYGSCITTHDDITFVFYSALLVELGKERSIVDYGHTCCMVSYNKVKVLLQAGEFQQAKEVTTCAFQLIKSQKWYHTMRNIGYGYKLGELMAGIDVRKSNEKKMYEMMLETSRQIVIEVLASCRAAKINFVALKFEDVAGLVRLLGEQQNYGELQFLLEQLWNSREVQKTWSASTVISIGRQLVHAYYANGHPNAAIELCDRLCYNLRHSHGWLASETIAASKLLSELYTATHRYREAMCVHEEILREIDEDASASADAKEPEIKVLAHKGDAHEHCELLKRSYQRLGSWHKNEKTYQDLYGRLSRFKLGGQPIDEWACKGADSLGSYHIPKEWKLVVGTDGPHAKRPGLSKAAARRSYGCGYDQWMGEREKRPSWTGEIIY